jgi:hypothetical protein
MKLLRTLALLSLLALTTSGAQQTPIPPGHLPAPVPPEDTMGLPPLPKYVDSQIGRVAVMVVPNLVCGGSWALGCFIGNKHVIYIREGMPRNVQWHTLEHEKVHVILWVSGHTNTLKDDDEDRLADLIGAARVQEMLARVRADSTH